MLVIGRIRIPFGISGMILGTIFLALGGDDLYWVWLSGFNMGWGVVMTIIALHNDR